MPIAKSVLDFRFDVDEEIQGWILVFATVTAVAFFFLPCYCAGLPFARLRQFAIWLTQRLPAFYLCALVFNTMFLALVIHSLPDWEFGQYMKVLTGAMKNTASFIADCASSIAVIVAFFFAVAFKDRIAQLCGFDHKTLFRFKIRDCLCCFGFGSTRFQPIEVAVWKVEDLPSAQLFSANNVFVELFLGYNEPMKTRVHNNAGSGCIIKENIHLNFDEDDEEDTLHVFVKNQKVMGSAELARAEISTKDLKDMVTKTSATWKEQSRWQWTDQTFGDPVTLIPRGKLWLQARAIHDADYDYSLMQDLSTC